MRVTSSSAHAAITGVTSDGLPVWHVPVASSGLPLGLSRYSRGMRELERDRRRHPRQPTLRELIARGRCPECGTLAGIWHKLGCSRDQ